jgi:hypothetical protein
MTAVYVSFIQFSFDPCLNPNGAAGKRCPGGASVLTRWFAGAQRRQRVPLTRRPVRRSRSDRRTLALSRCRKPERRRSVGCRQSGYSRRGDRSPRLCFKTVRAGFLAHGSSVICPLSLAPYRACDLHVRASPSRVIHTSLDGVLTASAARLIPITCRPPSPRRQIRWRSRRRWLLGESPHRAVSG